MVIHGLGVSRFRINAYETDMPLVVDAGQGLADVIASEFLKEVPPAETRDPQEIRRC